MYITLKDVDSSTLISFTTIRYRLLITYKTALLVKQIFAVKKLLCFGTSQRNK